MRIIVRPAADPSREVDMTQRLVSAIAEELWRLFGGNDQINWIEAERHLAAIVGGVRREAARTTVLTLPSSVPAACPGCPRRRAGGSFGRRTQAQLSQGAA